MCMTSHQLCVHHQPAACLGQGSSVSAAQCWPGCMKHWLAGQGSVVVAGCADVETMCSNAPLEFRMFSACMVTRWCGATSYGAWRGRQAHALHQLVIMKLDACSTAAPDAPCAIMSDEGASPQMDAPVMRPGVGSKHVMLVPHAAPRHLQHEICRLRIYST